jgi:hypothetical protein
MSPCEIRLCIDLYVPEFEEEFASYYEFSGRLTLTYLGREVAVAEMQVGSEMSEVTMRRATQTPVGTWR